MAAINFVKGEQYYTAEFQIKGPVNIHIERAEAGALYFRQRSIDHGSYDLINGANWNNREDLTIDTAIQGVVYPMWIKIESASEPTLAEMVEGEQSGGGAGTESGGEMRYYQIDMKEDTETFVQFYGTNMKADMGEGEVLIVGVGLIFAYNIPKANWKAVAINVDVPTYSPTGGGIISFREQLESNNGSIDDLADVGLINITKEQFYNLEA